MPVSPSAPAVPGQIQSVWIEPPTFRPPPIATPWAPPPMLVQRVPPRPFPRACWIGGYWIWQRGWLWALGMWSAAPSSDAVWVHPSYVLRQGLVLFVAGHWSDAVDAVDAVGVDGSFVPAPPGSDAGVVVPAPRGTPPAVMTSVPPLTAPGARVHAEEPAADGTSRYRVTAPGGCTRSGEGVELWLPAQAHVAAALPPAVAAWAPPPRSELSVRYVQARCEPTRARHAAPVAPRLRPEPVLVA